MPQLFGNLSGELSSNRRREDARLGQCETGLMDQGREDLTSEKLREDCEVALCENDMLDFVKVMTKFLSKFDVQGHQSSASSAIILQRVTTMDNSANEINQTRTVCLTTSCN